MQFGLLKTIHMQTLHQSYVPVSISGIKKQSIVTQFLSWCTTQEENRLAWLAVILAVHGCVLSPATVLLIVTGSNSIILWGIAIGAMGISLVTNLSAMPTRITIPVFYLSIVIDVVAVVLSFTTIF
jgi:hypothetical protein